MFRLFLLFCSAIVMVVSAYAFCMSLIPGWSGSGPIGRQSYEFHWQPYQFVNASIWGLLFVGAGFFLFRSRR